VTAPVHILAHCRNPKLLGATLLVFRTLRVGFPSAKVMVWGNALPMDARHPVEAACHMAGAGFMAIPSTTHDAWIESLIMRGASPFWVCDTDIAFWDSMQHLCHFDDTVTVAGRYEPAYSEEWSGTTKPARLHASLLYINPSATRQAIRAWMCRIPMPWRGTAEFPLIRQAFIPQSDGSIRFYDTCAGLFAAIGGTPFTEVQNCAFDHLQCGTYSDLVSPHLSCDNLEQRHRAIFADITLAKGIRGEQEAYLAQRKIKD